MRRVFALLLALSLVVSLCGCVRTPMPPADHVPPLGDNNDSGIPGARQSRNNQFHRPVTLPRR